MAHLDLATTTSSAAGLGAPRTFVVLGGDGTTKISFFIADSAGQSSGAPLLDGRNTRRNMLVLKANEQATFNDSSTFLGYTLSGTAPTAVFIDGPAPTANAVATTGAAGTVLLTTNPGAAGAPTAVSSTDPRVTTINVPVTLSATDGTLGETPVAVPGVAGSVSGVKLMAPGAITQNDTNFLTFTLKTRNGSGGSASNVASATTQVTGGVAFTAFQLVSLGALTNATLAAGTVLTLTSAKTGTGQAVAVPCILEITFTPTV